MAFTLVNGHKIYITTESSAAGIKLATTGLYDASPGNISAGTGIGVRDNVPLDGSGNAINLIPAVVSFDPTEDYITEDADFINGKTIMDHIPICKTGSITLTLKKQSDVFARIWTEAPAGVNTTTAAVEGMDNDYTSNAEFGYRIYIYDGSKYDVFYHCTVDEYSSPPGQDKKTALMETVTFSTYQYDPYVTSGMTDAEAVQ